MKEIQCKCGNTGCTTTIEIYEGTGSIHLIIKHKLKDKTTEQRETICLDPNEIVRLIKSLKSALEEIAR